MARQWLKAELHQALQRLLDAAYSGQPAQRTFSMPANPRDADVMLLDAIEELEQWRARQRCVETAEQVVNRLNQYYGGRAAAAERAASDTASYWRIKQETIWQVAKNLEITLRSRNQEGEANNGR